MKTSHYITSSFLIGALVVVFIGLGLINSSSNQATLPVYFIANQNYKSGNFTDAITGYYQALRDNPSLIQKEPLIRFKIGYGYFKTGDFQKSHDIFQKSQESLEVIQDYLEYFQLLSAIELNPEK